MKLVDDGNNMIFSERPSEFYRFILVPSKMEFYSCFIFYREFWLSKTFNNAGNPYEAILFSRIFFPENIPKWLLIFSNWSREQNIFLHTRGFFLSGLFMVGNSLISISLVFYIWFQSGLSKFRFDVHILLLKSVTSNNLGAHSCT